MGLWIAQFTELALWIGAGGVEISERNGLKRVGAGVIGEHALHHRLRGAVGIHWLFAVPSSRMGSSSGSP